MKKNRTGKYQYGLRVHGSSIIHRTTSDLVRDRANGDLPGSHRQPSLSDMGRPAGQPHENLQQFV